MYVNPMIDVAFKYLFGTEKHKNLLKGLLEHVFGRGIKDIEYGSTEQLGESLDSRNSYFDVLCHAKEGPDFIVECQVREQEYFIERVVYYTSRSVSNHAPKGEWDYSFRPIYFLGLTNFPLSDKIRRPGHYISSFMILNEESGEPMTDNIKFVFMEVSTFNKSYEECKTFEDKFLFYMKNLPTFADKPDTQSDQYFEELLQTAEYLKMDMETKAMYEKRLKEMRDIKNVEDYARKKNLAEGRAEGLKQGRAEGRAEGINQARQENLAEKKDMAKAMLADGMTPESVAKYTHLSIEEVLD